MKSEILQIAAESEAPHLDKMVVCGGRVDPFDSLIEVIQKLALVDLSDNGKDENDDLIVLKDGIECRRQSNSSDLTESDIDKYSGEDNNSDVVNDDLEESAETDLESIVSIASASGNEQSDDNNDCPGDDDSSDEDVEGEDPGPTKAPNSFKSARTNDVHHSASPYARPTTNVHGRVAGFHQQQNLNSGFPANNGYMPQVGCSQQLEFQYNGLQEKVQNSGNFLPTRQPSPGFGSEKMHLQVQPVMSSGIQNFPSSFPEEEALVQTNEQQDATWQLDCPANDFLNQLMLSVGVDGSDFEDISNLQGPSPSLANDSSFFANDFSLQNQQQQQQDERFSPSFQIGSDVTCMSVQSQASTMECTGMTLQPEIPTMIVPGTPSPFSVFSPCAKDYRRDSISQESHQDGGFSSSSGYEETNYFNDNCKPANVAQQQPLSHQQHYQQMPLTPFSDQSEMSSNGVNSPCQQLSPFSYGSASPVHQAVPEVVFTPDVSCNTSFSQPHNIGENFAVSAVQRDNSPVINMSRLQVSQQAAIQQTSSGLPKQGNRFLNAGSMTPVQAFDYAGKQQRPSTVATLSCQLPSRPQSLGIRYEVRDPIEGAILEFSKSLNPSLRRAMMAEIFSLPMSQIVTPSPGDNISLILAALRDRSAKKPRLEHIFALVMRLKAEHQLDVLNRPTYLNTAQLDSCYTYVHIFVLEAVKFALGNLASSNGCITNSVRVLEEDVQIFRFLLGCGASPYLKYNSSGDTLVHFMARLGDLTVPFLREIVQNPNVFDSPRFFSNNFEAVTAGWGQQGKTPLMVAREMDGQRSPFGHLVRTVEIQRLILSRMVSSSSS